MALPSMIEMFFSAQGFSETCDSDAKQYNSLDLSVLAGVLSDVAKDHWTRPNEN
jgi:hypothetical protein